jgi:hypothetical protein
MHSTAAPLVDSQKRKNKKSNTPLWDCTCGFDLVNPVIKEALLVQGS